MLHESNELNFVPVPTNIRHKYVSAELEYLIDQAIDEATFLGHSLEEKLVDSKTNQAFYECMNCGKRVAIDANTEVCEKPIDGAAVYLECITHDLPL